MIPMRDIKQISEGDKLFYEIGYKKNNKLSTYEDNWVRTGQFKEITDIKAWLLGDDHINDINYLEHHNFMLIKKNMMVKKGDYVFHQLSKLYYLCENDKHVKWMNANSFYIIASKDEIPNDYFNKSF